MSYTVDLYTLTKRSNSTLYPSSGATTYNCNIKNGSGILTPKIELNLGVTADPSQFNYCHIPNFDRWYYVTEWYYDRGLWTGTCKVDVLATYKSQIGSTSLYVLRASAASDGAVIDTFYPTKAGCTFDNSTISNPYNFNIFSATDPPQFCVGIVSEDGKIGSMDYFMIGGAQLEILCDYLINDFVSVTNQFDAADASMALQASLIDPIQYIKSCYLIPFTTTEYADVSTGAAPVKCCHFSTGAAGLKIDRGTTITKTFTFTIKKHPQTSARGNFVNVAPYTLLTLSFPPFGVIQIDTTVTANASSLTVDVAVDVITGKGKLTVRCNGVVLNTLEAQLGVPIQLSQVSSDYLGAATSAVNGLIQGLTTGFGLTSMIGNAVNALTPREQSVGQGGAFTQLTGHFALYHQFFTIVNDDNTHFGRPYCQVTTPSSLGGYMLIQDGDVPIPGTKAEADEIRSLLEGGFYYE